MDDFVSSHDDRRALTAQTQGFEDGAVYDADHIEAADAPIFSLGQVQFTLPSALFSLSCANNVLVLAVTGSAPSLRSTPAGGPTSNPQIIRIDLARPTEVETVNISLAPTQSQGRGTPAPTAPALHKVHVDPSGRHVIVSTSSGENFYLFVGTLPVNTSGTAPPTRKARPLPRLKGAIVDSVAWSPSSFTSPSSSTTFSTREILLGTTTGQILETNLVDPALASDAGGFSLPVPGRAASPEKYVKQLLTLPERQAIVGLRFETWGNRRLAVIAATATKVYQYVGDGAALGVSKHGRDEEVGLLETVMHVYSAGDARPKMLELPSDALRSELHFCSPLRTDGKEGLERSKTLAWMTGPGVYHGNLVFPSSSSELQLGDGVIDSASLIPYPLDSTGRFSAEEQPISMALTEHHFVILYEDKICAVDILTDKVVYFEELELTDGSRPIRLSTDALRKTCWMYTDTSIYELVIRDEDRDVWKVYLSRQNWDQAKRATKTQRQRDTVLAAEADSYYAAGRYIPAAQAYAQSSKSFEEVVLRFVDKSERDALRVYLSSKLESLRKTDLTQRTMIATWLVELYLAKINHLEDLAAAERMSEDGGNLLVERSIIEEDLRHFLSSYKTDLDRRTTYDLLERHGRDELELYYATAVGDHERIVRHHLAQQQWSRALHALAKQNSPELYYPFAATLLKNAPKETVDSFIRQPRLDLRRLIPSLTAPRPRSGTASSSAPHAHLIRYLEHAIFESHNTDAAVQNTLITLYATSPSTEEAAFVRFLETAPSDPDTNDPYYDLDYALRVARAHTRVQACVVIYSKMALYESSVDLALTHDDLELAKICADKPEDDEMLRKKLWLKIAKHVVGQKNDIKAAMQFLQSTNLLKIEDILPFFPDFVVIDDFKEEICSALEDYSAHIERLKEEMTEATRSAEAIKADIAELDNRFVIVEAGEKCGTCRQQLLTRQFYVFPCQHCFHADCLISEVTKTLSPTQLRRMLDLQARLAPSTAAQTSAPVSRNGKKTSGIFDDTTAQGLKLATASVQAVDQLRKLVLPDALLSAIGGAIPLPGAVDGAAALSNTMRSLGSGLAPRSGRPASGGRTSRLNGSAEQAASRALSAREKREEEEKEALRAQLDDLIASQCVLCEGSIDAVDRGFVDDGETM